MHIVEIGVLTSGLQLSANKYVGFEDFLISAILLNQHLQNECTKLINIPN